MNEFQEQFVLRGKLIRQHSLYIIEGWVYLRRFIEKLQYILRIALSCTYNERSAASERALKKCVEVGHAQTYLAFYPVPGSFPIFDIDYGAHPVSIACAESAGHEIHFFNHVYIKNSNTHIGYFLDMVWIIHLGAVDQNKILICIAAVNIKLGAQFIIARNSRKHLDAAKHIRHDAGYLSDRLALKREGGHFFLT